MKLNSNTLTNVTNTTQLDNRAFETLSLKVAEVQSLLAFLTHSDNLPERESLTVSVLERLTEWLQSDIQAMQAAFLNSVTEIKTPLLSYTNLSGETVTVETLDWLEDGYYWEVDEDFDEDGNESGDNHPCSRYCIGEIDGDGVSVWLNADMQEVEV